MTTPQNDLLLLAGKVLTISMQIALALGATAIAIAIGGVAFFTESINASLRADYGPAITPMPVASVLGLLIMALFFVIALTILLENLLRIIVSVAEGDPFIPKNAKRLTSMAWLMLAIYVLTGAAVWISNRVLDWARQFEDFETVGANGFDFGSVLLIIILFILARVFRHGAAMRNDLEGTV